MSGAGSSPAGSSSAGLGTPAQGSDPSSALFIQADGKQGKAHLISSGDYVVDGYGRPQGISSIQQRVYLAVYTAKGSSAVRSFGTQAPSAIISDTSLEERKVAVRKALASMVKAGLIAIVSLECTQPLPNRMRIHVVWRDLTSGGALITTAVDSTR